MPGPPCPICTHENKADIEIDITNKLLTVRDLSAKHKLHANTITRHKQEHMDKKKFARANTVLKRELAIASTVSTLPGIDGAIERVHAFAKNLSTHIMHLHQMGYEAAVYANGLMEEALELDCITTMDHEGNEHTSSDKGLVLGKKIELIGEATKVIERVSKGIQGSAALELFKRFSEQDINDPGLTMEFKIEPKKDGK